MIDENKKVKCPVCGQEFDESELIETSTGEMWCRDCIDSKCRKCWACGEIHLIDEMYNKGGAWLCEDCQGDWYECDACGRLVSKRDVMKSPNGDYLCQDCFNERYVECYRCGSIIDRDDANLYEDEYYCDDCYEDCHCRNGLYEYHEYCDGYYRRDCGADDKKDKMLLGVELECDDGSFDYDYFDQWSNIIHFEEDGSLSDSGVELITQPCTLLFHQRQIPWSTLCSKLKNQGFCSHDTDCCGLHVHMSRDAMSDIQVIKMDVFINRGAEFFSEIARRDEFYDTQYKTDKRCDKSKCWRGYGMHDSRYTAVNTTNTNTVEIRIFRGTLNYETILGTIEMCHALPRFLDTVPIARIYDTTKNIKNFIRFIADEHKKYPHFLPMARRLVRSEKYASLVGELYGKKYQSVDGVEMER